MFSRLFGSKTRYNETKAQNMPGILPVSMTTPNTLPSKPKGYASIVNEAYKASAVSASCITMFSQLFSQPPLKVLDEKGNNVPDHPFLELINSPNPWMSKTELHLRIAQSERLGGNAYIEKVRNGSHKVVELSVLSQEKIEIIPDEKTFISHYLFEVDGNKIKIPKENIIHFKNPDPLNLYYGMSPLIPAFSEIDTDSLIGELQRHVLTNSGIPTLIIKHGLTKEVNPDKERSIVQLIREKISGLKRGEPLFLGKGMDTEQYGLNFKQLALIETTLVLEARICAVLQVPPILIQVSAGLEKSTFANYKTALESFWFNVMMPYHNRFASILNNDPDFGLEGYKLVYDYLELPVMDSHQEKLKSQALDLYQSNIISIDEARATFNLEPVKKW